MTIRLLFFSLLRDISGVGETSYSVGENVGTVGDLLAELYEKYDGLSAWDANLLIAVNCEYAGRDTTIADGDEVALMPPVQGG